MCVELYPIYVECGCRGPELSIHYTERFELCDAAEARRDRKKCAKGLRQGGPRYYAGKCKYCASGKPSPLPKGPKAESEHAPPAREGPGFEKENKGGIVCTQCWFRKAHAKFVRKDDPGKYAKTCNQCYEYRKQPVAGDTAPGPPPVQFMTTWQLQPGPAYPTPREAEPRVAAPAAPSYANRVATVQRAQPGQTYSIPREAEPRVAASPATIYTDRDPTVQQRQFAQPVRPLGLGNWRSADPNFYQPSSTEQPSRRDTDYPQRPPPQQPVGAGQEPYYRLYPAPQGWYDQEERERRLAEERQLAEERRLAGTPRDRPRSRSSSRSDDLYSASPQPREQRQAPRGSAAGRYDERISRGDRDTPRRRDQSQDSRRSSSRRRERPRE